MKNTEADEIIFRIIGSESKTLDGLNIPESSGTSSNILTKQHPPLESSQSQESSSSSVRAKKRKIECDSNDDERDQYRTLKVHWLELQCELAQKDLQLRDLQILKMERELNIQTIEYPSTMSLNHDCVETDSSVLEREVTISPSKF